MSRPFRPKGFAFYWDRAREREEQERWPEAKEAWRRAKRFAKTRNEADRATDRYEYCKRKLEQIREQEQSQ